MLKSHPDLVQLLAQPWYFDRKNEVPEGKLPYFAMPIFNFHQVSLWPIAAANALLYK